MDSFCFSISRYYPVKVIIMCAGKSKRFSVYQKPKSLSLVEGTPNILRLWNQANSLCSSLVYVTVNKDTGHYFEPFGFNLIWGDNKLETQRFSNAFPLTEETVFLYGDAIYDDVDMLRILERRTDNKFFGRIGPNPITGKSCDELLGVHVGDWEKFMNSVKETDRQFKRKERKQAIGWDVYEVHEGLNKRDFTPNFVQLSYYSDDFDTLTEYENIKRILR